MPRKKKTSMTADAFWNSARRQSYAYVNYFDRLCNIAISVFKWENLPDTVDQRFLELTLLCNGYAVFFKDEVMGYLALRTMIGGPLDVYNIPTQRIAYASNGYQNRLDSTNSVLIYENYLHSPMLDDLCNYARDLYELDQIIMINCKAQKTPIMVIADENQRLTLKNLYAKYDGNEPFIFGNNGLQSQPLVAINTGAPFNAPALYDLRTNIWNMALTSLGVPANIQAQKKERLVTDEVHQTNGGAFASRFSLLEARRQACEQINNMFGLSIDVDYRDIDEDNAFDVPDVDNSVTNAIQNEEDKNE